MDNEVSMIENVQIGQGIRKYRLIKPKGLEFAAGQYFILKLDERLMKPFSFSNSPTEGDYIEFTTKMSQSDFKKRLASLKPQDKVRIVGPLGGFTLNPNHKKVVFLAGGIGITPFRSMIKYITDSKSDCDAILLWCVNTMDDAVFKGDFDRVQKNNPHLNVLYVPAKPPSGWQGPSGFMSQKTLSQKVPDYKDRTFYVCGPPKMIAAVDAMFAEMNVAKERIIVEQFG
jgi:ferredoxin-NADP reductase